MGAHRRALLGAVALTLLAGTACGSDDTTTSADPTTTAAAGASSSTTVADATTTTVTSASTLRILVTNDDGVSAPGLDAVVEAVRKLPGVELTVIAPADNQSGTGSKRTDGALEVTDATTASGYPAKAVKGFPADTVIYALEQGGLPQKPHLVLSGDNQGANIGPLTNVSGTIGAAKAAAARGIPALASSQGLATEPDYATGAQLVVDWVEAHRADLLAGTAPATATSINIPTCATGSLRGKVDVPIAADANGRELFTSNCASTLTNPVDDIEGFSNGFATYSTVPLDGHA